MFWDKQKLSVLTDSGPIDKSLWTVAGGKGGTGKSVLTANLGLGLSTLGYKTTLLDADLGGANLHTCLNIRRPSANLNDFLSKRVETLSDVLLETPNERLKLISGGSELIGIANLNYQKKKKLLRHMNTLDADFILVDLGAGTSYNTLDFFALSNEGIIICNPEPNAKLDAYAFLKNSVYRKLHTSIKDKYLIKEILQPIGSGDSGKIFKISDILDMAQQMNGNSVGQINDILKNFRPKLIMNKIRRKSQIAEGNQLVNLAKEYLGVQLEYVGFVEYDQKVIDASEKMMPFLLEYPNCAASKNVIGIIQTLGICQNDVSERKLKKQFAKEMKIAARDWE